MCLPQKCTNLISRNRCSVCFVDKWHRSKSVVEIPVCCIPKRSFLVCADTHSRSIDDVNEQTKTFSKLRTIFVVSSRNGALVCAKTIMQMLLDGGEFKTLICVYIAAYVKVVPCALHFFSFFCLISKTNSLQIHPSQNFPFDNTNNKIILINLQRAHFSLSILFRNF